MPGTSSGDSRIIHKHIDLLERSRQFAGEAAHLIRIADIQLEREYFDTITDLFDDICRNLREAVDASGRQDEL